MSGIRFKASPPPAPQQLAAPSRGSAPPRSYVAGVTWTADREPAESLDSPALVTPEESDAGSDGSFRTARSGLSLAGSLRSFGSFGSLLRMGGRAAQGSSGSPPVREDTLDENVDEQEEEERWRSLGGSRGGSKGPPYPCCELGPLPAAATWCEVPRALADHACALLALLLEAAARRAAPVRVAAESALVDALVALHGARVRATSRALEVGAGARSLASDRKAQATAAAAAGGAVVLGTGGGVLGLLAGGAAGAATGLVPALFTFGLSIPIGAAMGAGAGLCVGASAGGAAGLAGGGLAGRRAYEHREEIKAGVDGTIARVKNCTEVVKAKAQNSADFVRSRLTGGTGSTA